MIDDIESHKEGLTEGWCHTVIWRGLESEKVDFW